MPEKKSSEIVDEICNEIPPSVEFSDKFKERMKEVDERYDTKEIVNVMEGMKTIQETPEMDLTLKTEYDEIIIKKIEGYIGKPIKEIKAIPVKSIAFPEGKDFFLDYEDAVIHLYGSLVAYNDKNEVEDCILPKPMGEIIGKDEFSIKSVSYNEKRYEIITSNEDSSMEMHFHAQGIVFQEKNYIIF